MLLLISSIKNEALEITFTALKALYILSTMENIAGSIEDFNGMDKLLLCLKSKSSMDEIQRLAAKIIYNYYSGTVLPLFTLGNLS
jgi:hypothetical protein